MANRSQRTSIKSMGLSRAGSAGSLGPMGMSDKISPERRSSFSKQMPMYDTQPRARKSVLEDVALEYLCSPREPKGSRRHQLEARGVPDSDLLGKDPEPLVVKEACWVKQDQLNIKFDVPVELRDDVKAWPHEAGKHHMHRKEQTEWEIPFSRDSLMIVVDGEGDPGPDNPDAPEQYVTEPGKPPKKACLCCYTWTTLDADPPETRPGLCCAANICCCCKRFCKGVHCIFEGIYVFWAWLLSFISLGKVRLPDKTYYKEMNLHINHAVSGEGIINGMVMADLRYHRGDYNKVNDRPGEKKSREAFPRHYVQAYATGFDVHEKVRKWDFDLPLRRNCFCRLCNKPKKPEDKRCHCGPCVKCEGFCNKLCAINVCPCAKACNKCSFLCCSTIWRCFSKIHKLCCMCCPKQLYCAWVCLKEMQENRRPERRHLNARPLEKFPGKRSIADSKNLGKLMTGRDKIGTEELIEGLARFGGGSKNSRAMSKGSFSLSRSMSLRPDSKQKAMIDQAVVTASGKFGAKSPDVTQSPTRQPTTYIHKAKMPTKGEVAVWKKKESRRYPKNYYWENKKTGEVFWDGEPCGITFPPEALCGQEFHITGDSVTSRRSVEFTDTMGSLQNPKDLGSPSASMKVLGVSATPNLLGESATRQLGASATHKLAMSASVISVSVAGISGAGGEEAVTPGAIDSKDVTAVGATDSKDVTGTNGAKLDPAGTEKGKLDAITTEQDGDQKMDGLDAMQASAEASALDISTTHPVVAQPGIAEPALIPGSSMAVPGSPTTADGPRPDQDEPPAADDSKPDHGEEPAADDPKPDHGEPPAA